jgi:hypothetical protein
MPLDRGTNEVTTQRVSLGIERVHDLACFATLVFNA